MDSTDPGVKIEQQLKTHMLYEQLEVKLGNTLRPLINKLLTQIKENYEY